MHVKVVELKFWPGKSVGKCSPNTAKNAVWLSLRYPMSLCCRFCHTGELQGCPNKLLLCLLSKSSLLFHSVVTFRTWTAVHVHISPLFTKCEFVVGMFLYLSFVYPLWVHCYEFFLHLHVCQLAVIFPHPCQTTFNWKRLRDLFVAVKSSLGSILYQNGWHLHGNWKWFLRLPIYRLLE